jgi:hypothetical protein
VPTHRLFFSGLPSLALWFSFSVRGDYRLMTTDLVFTRLRNPLSNRRTRGSSSCVPAHLESMSVAMSKLDAALLLPASTRSVIFLRMASKMSEQPSQGKSCWLKSRSLPSGTRPRAVLSYSHSCLLRLAWCDSVILANGLLQSNFKLEATSGILK